MDKNIIIKQPYRPPKVTAVAFKVELGQGASGGELLDLGLFTSESYTSTGNSGDGFWGTPTSRSTGSGESYSNQAWSWD